MKYSDLFCLKVIRTLIYFSHLFSWPVFSSQFAFFPELSINELLYQACNFPKDTDIFCLFRLVISESRKCKARFKMLNLYSVLQSSTYQDDLLHLSLETATLFSNQILLVGHILPLCGILCYTVFICAFSLWAGEDSAHCCNYVKYCLGNNFHTV